MTAQNQVQISNTTLNGVDVDHVINLIGGIEDDDEGAQMTRITTALSPLM